ncbi:hypothetical protein SAMN02910370_00830 [Lachnospiraceae bacterium XPB1003]|nr:hypothetical protein SAMN02910370_00830 [Lachnospiraceae bacterium XPB1003]
MFFRKKTEKRSYDRLRQKPVIRASICTGEQVAGFKDLTTGAFEEVMLIRDQDDNDNRLQVILVVACSFFIEIMMYPIKEMYTLTTYVG